MMKIVLFGVGRELDRTLPFRIFEMAEIVAIIDNDKSKQGKLWNGYPISSPEIIKDIPYDKVVITSKKYFDEMYIQLHDKYNVPDECIMKIEPFVIPAQCNLGDIEVDADKDICYAASELSKVVRRSDNPLTDFFFYKQHRVIAKWWHYFEIYDLYFRKYIGKPVKVLEIGVFKGGSLQMWKEYFGKNAEIVGIDINPVCKKFEEDQIHICIGSQDDVSFLNELNREWGPFDIVIDDGGHVMEHQIASFEILFPSVKEGGVYLCEDTHTSYWKEFGGGFHKEGTFIEYAKKAIDEMNIQHIPDCKTEPLELIRHQVQGIHFYDSIVVFEKRKTGFSFYTTQGVED